MSSFMCASSDLSQSIPLSPGMHCDWGGVVWLLWDMLSPFLFGYICVPSLYQQALATGSEISNCCTMGKLSSTDSVISSGSSTYVGGGTTMINWGRGSFKGTTFYSLNKYLSCTKSFYISVELRSKCWYTTFH